MGWYQGYTESGLGRVVEGEMVIWGEVDQMFGFSGFVGMKILFGVMLSSFVSGKELFAEKLFQTLCGG